MGCTAVVYGRVMLACGDSALVRDAMRYVLQEAALEEYEYGCPQVACHARTPQCTRTFFLGTDARTYSISSRSIESHREKEKHQQVRSLSMTEFGSGFEGSAFFRSTRMDLGSL